MVMTDEVGQSQADQRDSRESTKNGDKLGKIHSQRN